jgi:hypothetical protein
LPAFQSAIVHYTTNYNYDYTSNHLRKCAEALYPTLPEMDTLARNYLSNAGFSINAMYRRLTRAVRECRYAASEEWAAYG